MIITCEKCNKKLEISDELFLIIKTNPNILQECKDLILKNHNYNIPEIIVMDGEITSNDYTDWVISCRE